MLRPLLSFHKWYVDVTLNRIKFIWNVKWVPHYGYKYRCVFTAYIFNNSLKRNTGGLEIFVECCLLGGTKVVDDDPINDVLRPIACQVSTWHSCNPLRAKFFRGNKIIYSHFMSFLHIDKTQVIEILPQARHKLILHSHGCWCRGDARSRGISNHDTGYVEANYFGPRSLRVDW